MGVLSATGRVMDRDPRILVRHVADDGIAAQAGLAVDDAILTIQGKSATPFSISPDTGLAGPQALLGQALNHCCSLPEPALELHVLRGGKKQQLTVALPASKPFAKGFPANCAKSATYLAEICDHLAATQNGYGCWQPGVGGDADDYCCCFAGLTLLAANDPKYLPHIKKALDFVYKEGTSGANAKEPNTGPKNWIAAAAAIFMAEYELATGDDNFHSELVKACDLLAARVSPTGKMGHHAEITYDGGGLTIVNAHAHVAWALAALCGYKVPSGAWERSLVEINKSLTKSGALGYSSRAVGDDDAPARTGAMAAALVTARQHPAVARAMGQWLARFNNRLPMAHTNASLGLIFGTIGIKLANPKFYSSHMQNWMPYLELCRRESGSSSYFGSKGNIAGDEYLGLDAIGNATVGLMLASAKETLFLFGGQKKTWWKAEETP